MSSEGYVDQTTHGLEKPGLPLGGVNERYDVFGSSMPSQLFGHLRSSIRQGRFEVYVIKPSSFSQWVVVQEWDWGKSHFPFFVGNGKAFPESHARRLPKRLRKTV